MGNSLSAKSKIIDKQLKQEQKRISKEIKILLLGKPIIECAYVKMLTKLFVVN